MEYDELVQYFNSDEDSINAKPPSFFNSIHLFSKKKNNNNNKYILKLIKLIKIFYLISLMIK